jgi:hypothetical protein
VFTLFIRLDDFFTVTGLLDSHASFANFGCTAEAAELREAWGVGNNAVLLIVISGAAGCGCCAWFE